MNLKHNRVHSRRAYVVEASVGGCQERMLGARVLISVMTSVRSSSLD